MNDGGRREPDRREPAPGEPGPSIRPFTAAQRRALVGALVIFIVCMAIALLRHRSTISDPMPDEGARFDQLADKLDPNVADAASLAALPQLGARRARDIVAYREKIRARDSTRLVYTKLEDLLRVRGMGATMIQHVEPYLTFPTTRPTTRE